MPPSRDVSDARPDRYAGSLLKFCCGNFQRFVGQANLLPKDERNLSRSLGSVGAAAVFHHLLSLIRTTNPACQRADYRQRFRNPDAHPLGYDIIHIAVFLAGQFGIPPGHDDQAHIQPNASMARAISVGTMIRSARWSNHRACVVTMSVATVTNKGR